MINSKATQEEFARAQVAAGEEPVGSKVTPEERVHLLVMVGGWVRATLNANADEQEAMAQMISSAMTERGLRSYDIADAFRVNGSCPVSLVNALVTHPKLKAAK